MDENEIAAFLVLIIPIIIIIVITMNILWTIWTGTIVYLGP